MPIRVLVVDDHPLYRRGTVESLAADDIEVAAAVGTVAEALAWCAEACPDVVLLDLNLPDKSGMEATGDILDRCPETAIVALTAHDEDAFILAMAEAGARGYLMKTATDTEIRSAVRQVSAGETAFGGRATEALLRRARSSDDDEDFDLTEREREVLQAAASGHTNRQIGRDLGISERTAQAHLSHIYSKLGVSSRTEAVTMALRNGLIDLAEESGG